MALFFRSRTPIGVGFKARRWAVPSGVTVAIQAEASLTEAADTLASAATLDITADAAITEAADTLSAAGNVDIDAAASLTESDDTLVAALSLDITADSATTEAADTLSAVAALDIAADLASTEAADILSGEIENGISLDAAITEAADSLAAIAALDIMAAMPDSSTTFLAHCDGGNGSTTLVDSSSINATITANGNAQIDTAQFKFGGSSLLCDGSGDYLSAPSNAGYAFGTGDFTIDFWMLVNAFSPAMAGLFNIGTYAIGLMFRLRATLLELYINGTDYGVAQSIGTGAWIHWAVARSGTTLKIFRDGTEIQSVSCSENIPQGALTIGASAHAPTTEGFNGWLEELRLSKDIARWTSNFIPPDQAYGPVTLTEASDTLSAVASLDIDAAAAIMEASDNVVFIADRQLRKLFAGNISGGERMRAY